MDLGIRDKVALVSGGSKGMGRAISEEFGREGVKVVVASRGQDAVDEAVKAIQDAGGKAAGVSADMTTQEGVNRAVDACVTAFGCIPDIAIANVHGTARATFEEAGIEMFNEAHNKLIMSAVYLARAVLPSMKEKAWGRIVTIGSFCSKQPHWHIPLAADNVARTGATALSKTLSNEYGPFGITVNTVAPGFIFTEMARDWMAAMAKEQGNDFDEDAAQRNDGIPVGRLGSVAEISAACLFLCSTRASYVTGQTLMVDGGLVGATY